MTSHGTAHALIVGAGPTGLSAGWRLAEAGLGVTIVDRAPTVGGMSASFDIEGQRVDYGSHRLHGRADDATLAELEALMGGDLQARQRNGRIRLEERWVAFPLRAGDLATSLPPRFAVGAIVDSLTSPLRKPRGTDFGSVVRAGLGGTVFDAFYKPYAKKLWGVDASDIDGAMAQRRVSAGGPVDIAKRLAAARNEEGRTFYYPANGYGQIAEALADACRSAGGDILLGSSLTSLTLDRANPSATVSGPHGDRTIAADLVVSTIPPAGLVHAVSPTAPADVTNAVAALESRGMVFVYLVVPRPQYTSFDAHYFPGADTVVARLSEPKNYRTGQDPANQTILCAELACTVGDDVWSMDARALGNLVASQLVDQGLADPEHVSTHVRRLPSVYPVYRRGYRAHLDVIEEWASGHSQLLTVGRQGLFVPDNLHHAMAMGRAVAEVVDVDGSIDRIAWSRRREEFRSHVVED